MRKHTHKTNRRRSFLPESGVNLRVCLSSAEPESGTGSTAREPDLFGPGCRQQSPGSSLPSPQRCPPSWHRGFLLRPQSLRVFILLIRSHCLPGINYAPDGFGTQLWTWDQAICFQQLKIKRCTISFHHDKGNRNYQERTYNIFMLTPIREVERNEHIYGYFFQYMKKVVNTLKQLYFWYSCRRQKYQLQTKSWLLTIHVL